jgi:signal transduction histidine kinase
MVPSGGPALVLAERARVLQVLENLLSNAVKYSPDGGEITISVTPDAAQESGRWPRPAFLTPDAPQPAAHHRFARVSVRDQGIGVHAADLPHLFDRFYRTDAVRGRGLEGTGLGLYICKGIIEAFGGRIGAESAGEGKGTRIWFTLPRAPSE